MTHRYAHPAPALHQLRQGPTKSQGGSILVQFALILGVLVAILGTVDIGYMYYAKRDLQRIADLAAIEAVQNIDHQSGAGAGSCISAGNTSIQNNWPIAVTRDDGQTSVTCGNWNPAEHAGPRYFTAATATGPLNAAHVVVQGTSPTILPGPWSRTIVAEAVARRNEPVAAFQVGSQLLNFDDNAILGRLLTLVGLDIEQLRVLDYGGLANAKITPDGLLKALGINLGVGGLSALSPDDVVKLDNLTLANILDASLEVISDQTLEADLTAIVRLLENAQIGGIKLLDLKTPLLSEDGSPGILAFLSLGSNNSVNDAALDLQLGIGDLVKTAIMVGANGHAISIPQLNVLNLVSANLAVVEPPAIGIGPIGTKANSSQIRLNIDIDSKRLPLLGDLLDAIGLRINLPIKVEGVVADATLETVRCPDPSRNHHPSIDLGVDSRLARVIIGHTDKSSTDPENILIKTPLSLNVRGPIVTNVLTDYDGITHLIEGESDWTRENHLFLGETVDAVLNTVFNLLGGIFSPPILSSEWTGMQLDGSAQDARNAQIEMLTKLYLEETKKNGFYNVQDALQLIRNGKGIPGEAGALGALITNDFTFSNAIPTLDCVWTLGLYVCPPSYWHTGSFSDAFTAYTSMPLGLLNIVGIPIIDTNNGYYSCAGLLSSLTNWNTCVANNLNSLLKNHYGHVSLTDSNSLINSLKDKSTDNVTCSGALCVLLQPLLKPVKAILNALGSALLSPLLTEVLGLNLGQSEVKALAIECDTAQLVY